MKKHYLGLIIVLMSITTISTSAQNTSLDSLIDLVNKLPQDTTKLNVLNQIAIGLEYEDFKLGHIYAEKYLQLAIKLGYPNKIAEAELSKGRYCANSQKLDTAEIHFKKAYEIFQETNNEQGKTRALGKIMFLAIERGESEKAIELGLDILDRIKGKNAFRIEALVNLDIARVLLNQKKYNSSLKYITKSDSIFSYSNMEPMRLHALRMKAFALNDLGREKEALDALNKAISIQQRFNPNQSNEILLSTKGNILKNQQKYNASYAAYIEALSALEKQNNPDRNRDILMSIGEVKSLMNENITSLKYLRMAELTIDTNNINPLELVNLYKQFCYTFLGLNEPDSSRHYFNKAFSVSADYYKDNLNEKGQELLTKYETQLKENEILSLKTTNIANKSRFYLMSFISSLLLLFSYNLYINNKKSKKHNKALNEKNKIIQTKSDQNKTLLKEIHHRVKNNLQTISSLLYLQSSNISDQDAKEAITQGQYRVESIALIHKNLYQRDNLAGIEMKDYIDRLATNLRETYSAQDKIDIHLNMNEIEMDVDTAIPLGLIINELLTNVFKYAFPDNRKGLIEISLEKTGNNKIKLRIKDNGTGNNKTNEGFGSQLIRLLTKQLDATFTDGNHDGYWIEISLTL